MHQIAAKPIVKAIAKVLASLAVIRIFYLAGRAVEAECWEAENVQ